MGRVIVVQGWDGPTVLARLRSPAQIAALTDGEVFHELERLGLMTPDLTSTQTASVDGDDQSQPQDVAAILVARRARLLAYPTNEDLSAIAVARLPRSGGVMPTVRVLESASLPPGRGVGGAGGPAGAFPRRRVAG